VSGCSSRLRASRGEVKPAWIEIAPKLAVAAAASIVRPPSQEGDHPWEEPITPRQLGPNFLQGTARILRESEIADAPVHAAGTAALGRLRGRRGGLNFFGRRNADTPPRFEALTWQNLLDCNLPSQIRTPPRPSHRRGFTFVMNQSAGPRHTLPPGRSAVLYRCPPQARTCRSGSRTTYLTIACTSRCGVPLAPESISSTEQAEASCRPGPDCPTKKAPR
jgi:hypothetical protein